MLSAPFLDLFHRISNSIRWGAAFARRAIRTGNTEGSLGGLRTFVSCCRLSRTDAENSLNKRIHACCDIELTIIVYEKTDTLKGVRQGLEGLQNIKRLYSLLQGAEFNRVRGGRSHGLKWNFPDESEGVLEQGRRQSREDTEIWFRLLLRFFPSRGGEFRGSDEDLRDSRPVCTRRHFFGLQLLHRGVRAECFGEDLHDDGNQGIISHTLSFNL